MGNIDPGVIAVLIPIVAIIGGFATVIMRQWAQHRERIAMIQMGMHPDHLELEAGEGEELDLDLDLELEPGRERSRDRS